MFEQMVQQPAKFALVGKGHRTIDAVFTESEKEKKLRPEYYNDLFYQKIGSDKGGNPIYAHLDLPYMEINRLFNSAHWLSSVNPVTFKLLLETKYNVKTFPKVGLRIEDPPGKLVPAPAWIMFLPKKAKDVLGLQLMVNPDTKRRDIVGMTAKKRYAISVMFPMFEEWDKANPQPIKRYEKKAPWRTLSYWTGIKFDVNDLEMQRKYRLIEKYGLMNEARLLMHYTGKPPTAKEINEILSGKRKR